jgi:dihydroxy-acid dehydratase
VPAVIGELLRAGLLDGTALTANGRTLAENNLAAEITDTDVIRPLATPLLADAGLMVLAGNLFDAAVMKTSVISDAFRARYLSNPADPDAFEGSAVVFDGPEDYHARIDDPALAIDANSLLVIRGVGPIAYPGGAEVVNMRAPAALIRAGIDALPCIGDGRQSGTSGSPSILNASPEAAAGGGLALLQTGDRIRIDLKNRTADMLVPETELAARRAALEAAGGYEIPEAQTPWQELHRQITGQYPGGAVIEAAVPFQRIAQTRGLPRDSH